VQELPEEAQDVFKVVWFRRLKMTETAEILGVSRRTDLRRWQAARLQLHQALQGILPES
jgi:DNA-directed RNA polymerase specialized sigma24 family protein